MMKLPLEFRPIYAAYLKGDITIEELTKQGKKLGVTVAPYNPIDGRNPIYPKGNNSNRIGFTHGLQSPLGKKFQGVMKPAMIVFINKMHKWICGEWDKDAFVYDDPRMQVLDENIHGHIDELFDHEDRKLDFMHKIADICLFMMKEDCYYAPRAFDLINRLPLFILTASEIENIETFSKGVSSVDQFTMKPIIKSKINPVETSQC